jgi:hypothetical protein
MHVYAPGPDTRLTPEQIAKLVEMGELRPLGDGRYEVLDPHGTIIPTVDPPEDWRHDEAVERFRLNR